MDFMMQGLEIGPYAVEKNLRPAQPGADKPQGREG